MSKAFDMHKNNESDQDWNNLNKNQVINDLTTKFTLRKSMDKPLRLMKVPNFKKYPNEIAAHS